MDHELSAEKSGNYRWYVVSTLMIGYLFAFLDRTMIGLMVEPIQSDLQISDTQMSLLMGIAFTLLYSIAGIPIGYLADRFNRVRIIKVGAVIWCVMTAACGLSTSFLQLFFARMLVGLGEASLLPSANSLISDYFEPEKAGKAISVFNLGMASGAGLSLILGGQLISWISESNDFSLPFLNHLAPWQIVFVLLGISGLIFLLLMSFVKEPPRTGRVSEGERWSLDQTAKFFIQNIRLYGSLCFCLSMVTVVSFAVLSWIPTYFIRIHGWSPAEAGYSYGLAALGASFIGMGVSGWWIDHWRSKGRADAAWRVLIIGVVVCLPGYIGGTLFVSTSINLVFLMFGVFGGSLAAIAVPNILMTASPNEARGMSVAMLYLLVNLFGAAIGPTSVALLNDYVFQNKDAIGWSIAIVALVGYVAAAAAALLGAPHYRRRLDVIAGEA